MDVFDEAATAIKESLLKAGIEIYPPGSVIIQRPKEEMEETEP